MKTKKIIKFVLFLNLSLLFFISDVVSVKADTTTESIEALLFDIKDFVISQNDKLEDLLDWIHGENGNYSLNSLIYDQTNKIYENSIIQKDLISDLKENVVSSNELLNHVDIGIGETVITLNDLKNSNVETNDYLKDLQATLDITNEKLSILSDQAEIDISNADLLEGLTTDITALNTELIELDNKIEDVNTFLGFIYAFFIFCLVVIIAVVLYRLINKTLINNMFRGS